MSLYPSLEDMMVGQMAQAQQQVMQQPAIADSAAFNAPVYNPYPVNPTETYLYPSLDDYMGISLHPIAQACEPTPQSAQFQGSNCLVANHESGSNLALAPITGDAKGYKRAEIKNGVREVVLCKDENGKMGLRVKAMHNGVFVAFVHKASPAAMVGLRFGDQILQIDGKNCAGWDTDKAMKGLKKTSSERITLAIRDRPFERTVSLQKDSTGHIGFVFKDGLINGIVKDSSAARNGILTDHQIVEIDGQNIIGLKDKEVQGIINSAGHTVTMTILPRAIYCQIVKSLGSSLIKKLMDHSVPDL